MRRERVCARVAAIVVDSNSRNWEGLQVSYLDGSTESQPQDPQLLAAPASPQLQPQLQPQASSSQPPDERDQHELHDELKDCECWADVMDIIADECATIGARNAVYALNRLSSISRNMPSSERRALIASPTFHPMALVVQRQLPNMTPFQGVNCFSYLAGMGYPLASQPKLMAAFDARFLAVVGDFNERDISGVMHAYAKLGVKPSAALLAAIDPAAQSLLDQGKFTPQGISMLLHSYGKFGHNCPGVVTAALAQLKERLSEAQPQAVANVTCALAKLDRYSAPWLQLATAYIQANAAQFKPQEMCNTLSALARMRHHPQAALNTFIDYAVRNVRILRPADLANLFYGLGVFGHHPGDAALGVLLPRVETLLSGCSNAELANIYWGLGLIGAGAAPAFERLTELLPARHAQSPFSEPLQRQLFQGWLGARLGGAELRLEMLLMDSLKRAWVSQAHPTTVSPVHAEISDCLKRIGVQHDTRRPTKDGLASIDIALKTSATHFVAVQVIGDHEQAANTRQLLGPALLQRQLLESNGWEVKFLEAREYWRLEEHVRPLFLAEFVKGAGGRATGKALAPRGGAKGGRGGAAAGRSAKAGSSAGVSHRDIDLVVGVKQKKQTRRST